MTQKPILSYDCVILGAGLVGTVMALRLHHAFKGKNFKIAVIEPQNIKDASFSFDGRTTAISYGSSLILKKTDLWEEISPHVNPIQKIRVLESHTPFTLNFSQQELHHLDHPMGYMVDNSLLRSLFQKKLLESAIALKLGITAQSFEPTSKGVVITLSDQTQIRAKLIIGAEGKHSPSRNHFGIKAIAKDYGQTAMVGTVAHQAPHQDTAYEVFHPKGPLAFLPMAGDTTHPHKSALVWSSSENLRFMDEATLAEKINNIFPTLGPVTFISKIMHYPLSYQKTSSMVGDRYALIGDAAHTMHPVAGQGVNLGWRDADVLADGIIKTHALGLDIGAQTHLQAYNNNRQKDQKSFLYTTHSLIKLFSIESTTLQMLRSYGLGLVNRIPPLKRFLMKKAMGI